MVHVLITGNNVQVSARRFELIIETFPLKMKERALQFRRWQDAQAFVFGKLLLLEAFKLYGFDSNILHEIKYNPYDRPYLPGPIDFNLSHSGKFIICAISNDCRVGIDIEEIHDIKIEDFANQFSVEELRKICEAHDECREFFKYWTIKEAVIKADGRGLQIPLKEILIADLVVLDKKPWYFYQLDTTSNYMSHLVTDHVLNKEIRIQSISNDDIIKQNAVLCW